MTTARVPAWLGLTVDHLFADCPNRMRGEKSLRWCGWWAQCRSLIDPDGTDVCGMCRHRYHRTNPTK